MKKIILLMAIVLGAAAASIEDITLTESVCKDVVFILKEDIAKEENKLAKLNMRILIECLENVQKPTSDMAIKKCVDKKKQLYDIPTGDSL